MLPNINFYFLKTQHVVDTLKAFGCYVRLTIIIKGIRGGTYPHKHHHQPLHTMLHLSNAIYACMQQIHLIAIKYPTLLMLNKCKPKMHQQPLFPT